jgi:SAM-dependent methyltransferase
MSELCVSIQRGISAACEEDLATYGDTFRGAGYTKSADEARQRYALMLDIVREGAESCTILDFGCGLGHLYDYLRAQPAHARLHYTGLDLSPKYLDVARRRLPGVDFLQMDVLESDAALGQFDYVIMNGVFNYRGSVEYETMVKYWQQLVSVMFRHCRLGLAFNVMSRLVEWQRSDLFHLPLDTMAEFVGRSLSAHFVVRHDYGAREYTTYVYRTPTTW